MRGLRRAERLFHMAVKQCAKQHDDPELQEQWNAYLGYTCNLIGFMRTRHWWWPEEEAEGC